MLGLAICTGLLVVLIRPLPLSPSPPQRHPLPPTLAKWQDTTHNGDYFSQIKPTEVGYLIWSQFPVRVYVEQPEATSSTDNAQMWVKAVLQAVQEWSVYLPLEMVEQQPAADIMIMRSRPLLRTSPTGISRARSAETRYELYSRQLPDSANILYHHCTILLSFSQTSQYIQAAARHELGHALGIWGHSPVSIDALYFAQVRNPPPISVRDVNTLKRVYEQPTSLGWSLH